MQFEYTPDTNEDDIIEHLLMRLNTDFAGGSLQVPDFCRLNNSRDYDPIMEPIVREKMYRYDVAKRSTGTGQPETAIVLTAHGAKVYRAGGWKVHLANLAKKKQEENNKIAYKEHLELRKNEFEIEKLQYEKSIRELQAENTRLSSLNLKLQNAETTYRWISGIIGFLLGLLALAF